MTSASQPPRVRNVSPSSRFFFSCKNCRSGDVYLQSPSGEELWLPPTAKSNKARMIFFDDDDDVEGRKEALGASGCVNAKAEGGKRPESPAVGPIVSPSPSTSSSPFPPHPLACPVPRALRGDSSELPIIFQNVDFDRGRGRPCAACVASGL